MKKIVSIVPVLLSVCACVYDYYPDVSHDKPLFVIEGDILLGEVCEFSVNSAISLQKEIAVNGQPVYASDFKSVSASFEVEDDRGGIWEASGKNKNIINLTSAPSDRKYRLHARVHAIKRDGTIQDIHYASSFVSPEPIPEIGDIMISPDSLEAGKVVLQMNLSAPGSSGCYRWDHEEIYRFHSILMSPTLEYNPNTGMFIDHKSDMAGPYAWWKYTWCWGHRESKHASIAIAKAYEGEALVNHRILSYDASDTRFNAGPDGKSMFFVKIKARAISEECYRYLDAVNKGSEQTSSLLAPIPGEVIGNIRNVADSTDYAIGYVSVSASATKLIKVNYQTQLRFSQASGYGFDPLEMLQQGASAIRKYTDTYNKAEARPFDAENNWVPLNCIDCTQSGGTLEPPAEMIPFI